jgi:DNA-binding CsgD family transcriptional regulator
MLLVEDLSELVRNVYQAVYDADHWIQAVQMLMRLTRSRLSQFSTAEGEGPASSWSAGYVSNGTSTTPIGAGDGACMSPNGLLFGTNVANGAICVEALAAGTSGWQLRYARQFPDVLFSVAMLPEAGAEAPPANMLAVHKMLFDHVGQALRLAARTPDVRAMREPTVVVDSRGGVMAMSNSAGEMLDRGGCLLVRGGVIAATSRGTDDKLRAAIATSSGAEREVAVVRPTENGERDHLIVVTPYPWALTHLPIRSPAAVVRILDVAASAALPAHVIEMFGFTKREAEVAGCLLAGHSLESLCYSLGISRNTGKVHLRSLFRKTSTSRQADLIGLLSRLMR